MHENLLGTGTGTGTLKEKFHAEHRRISPVFILPGFQNQGIGQIVIRKIFDQYKDTITWQLDTIQQEAGNCHLYEKIGFVYMGKTKKINDVMTLIQYEKSNVIIQKFKDEDAERISHILGRNFIEVNSKDYGIKAMTYLAKRYNADWIRQIASYAHMYTFLWERQIVAVGSISGYWDSLTESIILTVFVIPELHGMGIGRNIIQTLEKDEYALRAERIEIPASITATEFYIKLGYDYKNGVKEIDEEQHYRLEKFKEISNKKNR